MRRRAAVQQAFDEARFGATRMLNVREPMLSGDEAVRRADGWLRAKQVEEAGEVLIITGRGNQSEGQVAVVREAVLQRLNRLRRAGVVASVSEHTPGSFVVHLAPLRALFEAPPRIRDGRQGNDALRNPASLVGLSAETLALLRHLAVQSLHSLGVADPDEGFIQGEMERKFSVLARGGGPSLSDDGLRAAIRRALIEYEELEG